LSSDGRTIAVGSLNGSVDLLDVADRQILRRIKLKNEVLAIAFSPDGNSIAVATGSPPGSIVSGAVTLFSTRSGEPQWNAACHGNAALIVAFSPDGRTVVSGGNDSWLKVWDASTGKLLQQHEVPTIRIATLAFSPDGKLLATATEPFDPTDVNYNVLVFDYAKWKQLQNLIGHSGRVTCVSFSPDGRTLASGGLDDMLRLWRLNMR
jgi:WD40 repeat protein